jgi:hypothetical protein
MSIKKVAWFAVVASVFGMVSPAAARTGDEARCVFDQYAPLSVSPFEQDEDFGLGTYTRLRGAQVYVGAQPGLTAEWLALSVQRELAKLDANTQCRPSVRGVQVQVASAGGGFWVMLSTKDDRSAQALLDWARGIVPAAKR